MRMVTVPRESRPSVAGLHVEVHQAVDYTNGAVYGVADGVDRAVAGGGVGGWDALGVNQPHSGGGDSVVAAAELHLVQGVADGLGGFP